MSVLVRSDEEEKVVMESTVRLVVKNNGVELSTFFEEPVFVADVQVEEIDFLGGKVFLVPSS